MFNCLIVSYVDYWVQSIDFISTVIGVQDALVQALLKAGLVDHVVGLLTTEIEKSPEEKLDRYGVFLD
jgi:hypothetical protein